MSLLAEIRAYVAGLPDREGLGSPARHAYRRAFDAVANGYFTGDALSDAQEREAHLAGVAAVEALRADVAAGEAAARGFDARLRAAEQEAAAYVAGAAKRREQRANESRSERIDREQAEIRAACMKYAREHPDDGREPEPEPEPEDVPHRTQTVAGMLLHAPTDVYIFPTRG